MMKIKQVIVIRKDLNMRKGKIAAQTAHASFAVFKNLMKTEFISESQKRYSFISSEDMSQWLDGEFTKICVSVKSEEELIEIHKLAKEKGLLTSLIKDAGHTEFNGIPTLTCCAIGPANSDEIDEITGNLPLL